MVKDLGIYENDINKIINVIGEDFEDIQELRRLLKQNIKKFNNISYISKYVIKNLI